jgi:hypothetical protein
MPSTYRPQCTRCKVYNVASYTDTLCSKCQREKDATRAELEAEALEHARKRAAKPAKSEVPYCGACMTTLFVRDVSSETNVGLCLNCKAKHRGQHAPSLASSYGTPRTPSNSQDQNSIY